MGEGKGKMEGGKKKKGEGNDECGPRLLPAIKKGKSGRLERKKKGKKGGGKTAGFTHAAPPVLLFSFRGARREKDERGKGKGGEGKKKKREKKKKRFTFNCGFLVRPFTPTEKKKSIKGGEGRKKRKGGKENAVAREACVPPLAPPKVNACRGGGRKNTKGEGGKKKKKKKRKTCVFSPSSNFINSRNAHASGKGKGLSREKEGGGRGEEGKRRRPCFAGQYLPLSSLLSVIDVPGKKEKVLQRKEKVERRRKRGA